MNHLFHPFTPELFKKETGMDATENEAIYFRWLNAHMNYSNYQNLSDMARMLKELTGLIRQSNILPEEQRLA